MKYTECSREKDIMSVMWNVFASFGYKDAVGDEWEKGAEVSRFAVDKGLKCSIVLCGSAGVKAMAEITSAAIEAALAVEFPDFFTEISCPEEVKEMLYLYSLDEYCQINEGEFKIVGKSGSNVVFEGCSKDGGLICEFDLVSCAKAMENGHGSVPVSETVLFAEKNAEGIAYEIAYTMRLSGCLVTNYLGDGTIDDCERQAKQNSAESIIRVYPDGKIQIKEIAEGTVTETDYNTFVGYYDDFDEEEDHHHHGHDCNCGHCH